MKPRTEDERAARLYAPCPVPTASRISRSFCNVWVPIGASDPWWLVIGRPLHGAHVEALPFPTSSEAWKRLGRQAGFLVDARVMYEAGRSRADILYGISVQHSTWNDPALGGSELNRRSSNPGE